MARPFGTKNIETPERMWQLFCNYRDELRSNPILIVEQRKGTVIQGKNNAPVEATIELPARRPLTMEGFENYCADMEVVTVLQDYFSNRDNRYEDYVSICQRIRRTIRQDQIEGGMCGIFNASITQRLNGLVEKNETTLKAETPIFTGIDLNVPENNSPIEDSTTP